MIEWQDEGIEARVRMYLNRPEGDIYHSDVWDIRLVNFDYQNYDVVMEAPPMERDYFVNDDWTAYGNEEYRLWHSEWEEALPAVHSLADLVHFDSLQIFGLKCPTGEYLTDLSGLESCEHLMTSGKG